MATSRIKKPSLLKLKGNLKLDSAKRFQHNVVDGLLVDEYKHWSNYKGLVDSYFENVDACEESAYDFVTNLLNTLDRLADRSHKHTGSDLLFSNYCINLHTYYNDKKNQSQIIKYYCRRELLHRMKNNEKDTTRQARSTALRLSLEQGNILEGEATRCMILKRKIMEETDKGRSPQKVRYFINDDGEELSEQEAQQQEEWQGSTDNSFDSVERHPSSRHYYNYFVGDKHHKWVLGDGDGVHWMTKDSTNISKVMYKYRRQSYKAAKMMCSISSERILSLSFIFIINPNNIEGFVADCKSKGDDIRRCFEDTYRRSIPDDALIITNRIDNFGNSKNRVDEYIAKLHGTYWNSSLEMTVYYNVINLYCQHISPLTRCHTEQDHDSYEFFTKEIFHSSAYLRHKMSKHLSTAKDYIPDYKLAYQHKFEKTVDLFIIEVKKDKKPYTPDDDDKIKLNLDMQLMLNELILLNVNEPVVYGLLIQDHDCLLYEMSIKYEAQYVSRIIEEFYLPRDIADICLVPRVISIFLTIKDLIDTLIKKIDNRKKEKSALIPFMREGMKMPCLIKDPLSYCLNINSADYIPPE